MAVPRRLNMLYVGPLPPHPGGGALSCFQILQGLAGRGHRARALAPITAAAQEPADIPGASNPGVAVSRYVVPFFSHASGARVEAGARAEASVSHGSVQGGMVFVPPPEEFRAAERKQLSEMLPAQVSAERPDVLIAREISAEYVVELAAAFSLPSVLLVRGFPTVSILNDTCPEAVRNECLELYRTFDSIIAPAQHMARGLRSLGFENVTMIPNAVDVEQFSPAPKNEALLRALAIDPDQTTVLHIANLHPRKRTLDIVHSAVQATRVDPTLVYVIVGDGMLRREIEESCTRAGVAERFRFVGWVEYSRVPEYVNLADLVVSPSEQEGLARVYLEAQACGRVLLASDIPPAREVVVHGETGLLFRKGDVDDLTAKTLLAASNPELRVEIGRNARRHAETRHALETAVSAYEAVLGEVVEAG